MIVGKMIADCVFKNKASIANQTLRSLFDFLYDVTVFLLFSVWGKKMIQETSFLGISFGFKSLLKMS